MVSTEKAIEIDTARGRPSGIATMTMATAVVKILKMFIKVSLLKREDPSKNIILRTMKMRRAKNITKPAM